MKKKYGFWIMMASTPVAITKHNSLFLTSSQKDNMTNKMQKAVDPMEKKEPKWHLSAILHRPDSGQWIVWINGQKIERSSPISLDGWIIIEVTSNSVVLKSPTHKKKTLYVQDTPWHPSSHETLDTEQCNDTTKDKDSPQDRDEKLISADFDTKDHENNP